MAQQDELSPSAAEFVLMATCFHLTVHEQAGALPEPEQAFDAAADSFPGQLPAAIVWTFASSGAASVGDVARLERSSRRVLEAAAGELPPMGSTGIMRGSISFCRTARPRSRPRERTERITGLRLRHYPQMRRAPSLPAWKAAATWDVLPWIGVTTSMLGDTSVSYPLIAPSFLPIT